MDDRVDLMTQPIPPDRGPLRAHAWFITVFVVSAALTALVMTYTYSERYAGETVMFFKPVNILKLNDSQVQALGSPVPNTPFKVISQTLSGLAKSDSLLRQAVLDLGLQVPEPKTISPIWYIRIYKEVKDWVSDNASDAWSLLKYGRIIKSDPLDDAIADVRKGLKIVNEDSYVFNLTARGKTPEAAAAIANRVAERLSELLRQDDVSTAGKQNNQIRALLAEKTDEMMRLEHTLRDLLLGGNIASVQAAIEKDTEGFAKLQLARADARSELSQEEARLSGLASKLRQQSPVLLSGATADDLATQRAGRLSTAEFAKLSLDRQTAEINVGGLRSRVASYDQSVGQMEQRLTELARVQAEYGIVSQQLQSTKRDFTALRDALAESTIKAGDLQNEIRTTSAATPSAAPVSPIKVYHVGLATVVAAMLACGLAYVFAYFDVRLFLPRSKEGDKPASIERAPTAAIGSGRSLPTSVT